MAGNSSRRGAVRKQGSKKGATTGSGGQRRRGLEPKGPTPKADARTGHVAARKQPERTAKPRSRAVSRVDGDVVVGRNPVREALRARMPATELIVLDFVDADERITESVSLAADNGVPVRERPRRELDELAGDVAHQGVVLRVSPFAYAEPDELIARALGAPARLLVALDGITDPHNLGAIARSTAAFGGSGILVPARRSAGVTPAAWRASAGAFASLGVAQVTNLTRTLTDAGQQGFFVIGLAGGATADISEVASHFADVPVILVIGAEGEGLSRLLSERCDQLARIPMPGGFESLNASVAAGIALYTITTARH